MKSLYERLNMQVGEIANAHIIKNVHLGCDYLDTLSLICSEQDIVLDEISDNDFFETAQAIKNFIANMNSYQETTLSIWFDEL